MTDKKIKPKNNDIILMIFIELILNNIKLTKIDYHLKMLKISQINLLMQIAHYASMFMQKRLSKEEIDFFRVKAGEKIKSEGWEGRRKNVKADNFLNCWASEEAFKKILADNKAWFRHRGLYVGDSIGAGEDFSVRLDNEEKSIGIRSTTEENFQKYKEVAYPDDRFRSEKWRIADYIIICTVNGGDVKFYGAIKKEKLIEELGNSERKYSKANQEYFRVAPVESFSYTEMAELLQNIEKI